MKKALLSSVALVGLFAGPAMAADMAARPIYRAPVPLAVSNWTGFYIGGNVGGSIGIANSTDTLTGAPTAAASVTNNERIALPGAIGGGQVGYNWQAGTWLLGVEGDWQWSNEEATSSRLGQVGPALVAFTATDQERIRDLATVRGRVGFIHGDYLWFATGGGAWSRVESNFSLTATAPAIAFAPPVLAGFRSNKSGWTVGGGVETLLAGNWSAKLEYLYVDLGTVSNVFAIPTAAAGVFGVNAVSERVSEHIIRVGVNYRFGNYPIFAR
jgi:outer membrane immunogenic protein